jgi:hypothetical protein
MSLIDIIIFVLTLQIAKLLLALLIGLASRRSLLELLAHHSIHGVAHLLCLMLVQMTQDVRTVQNARPLHLRLAQAHRLRLVRALRLVPALRLRLQYLVANAFLCLVLHQYRNLDGAIRGRGVTPVFCVTLILMERTRNTAPQTGTLFLENI